MWSNKGLLWLFVDFISWVLDKKKSNISCIILRTSIVKDWIRYWFQVQAEWDNVESNTLRTRSLSNSFSWIPVPSRTWCPYATHFVCIEQKSHILTCRGIGCSYLVVANLSYSYYCRASLFIILERMIKSRAHKLRGCL